MNTATEDNKPHDTTSSATLHTRADTKGKVDHRMERVTVAISESLDFAR